MSTLTLSAVEVPVTDVHCQQLGEANSAYQARLKTSINARDEYLAAEYAAKPKRSKAKQSRWVQRPDESKLEFDNRYGKHLATNARAMQAKRAKARQDTFDKAEAIMRKAEHDYYVALNNPTAHVSRIDPNASFDQMNIAMRNKTLAVQKIEALQAVVSALPKRLVGTKQGQDIIASLTEHFRPFSRTNKHKIPAWDVCGKRTLENLRIYNVMRANSPWKVSRAEPIPVTAHHTGYHHTLDTSSTLPHGPFPDTWSGRVKVHEVTVTARFQRETLNRETFATPSEVEFSAGYIPTVQSVRTPVTLYASSALGRANGVFSVYPRVQDTNTR